MKQKRFLPGCCGKTSTAVLFGIAVTVVVLFLHQLTWPNHLELKLLDFRHRSYPVTQEHPDLFSIVIDDDALRQIGKWTWPRRYFAYILQLCHQAGAKQVLMDIQFPEEENRKLLQPGITDTSCYEPPAELIGSPHPQVIHDDAILAEALGQSQNVILTFYAYLSASKQAESTHDAFSEKLFSLLRSDPSQTFEDVFGHMYPGRPIRQRDPDYYQLLLEYIDARSQIRIERFSFDRPDEQVAIAMPYLQNLKPPFLLHVEQACDVGFATDRKDADGVVRRIPLAAWYNGKIYKQLAFSTLCQYLGIANDQIDLSTPGTIGLTLPDSSTIEIPVDKKGCMMIAWTRDWRDEIQKELAPSEKTYISVSHLAHIWQMRQDLEKNESVLRFIEDLSFQLSSVPADISSLDPQSQEQIARIRDQLERLDNPEEIRQTNQQLQDEIASCTEQLSKWVKGKIVLIGSVATAVPDFVVTPNSPLTPGMIVHRNIINTVLGKLFIRRPPRWLEYIGILLMGLIASVLTAYLRPALSVLCILLLLLGTFVIVFQIGFAWAHMWISITGPVSVILATFLTVTFYSEVTEGRARRLVTARFKQYTSPAVVDRIVSSSGKITMAGETRTITCFFSDLAGFTSISEHLDPHQTVSILNHYLDAMTEVLDRYQATVNKFQGDGIFAFFGAPIDLPDHNRLACLAALDCQKELENLVHTQQQSNPDFPHLKMRIGLSAGPVVVGDCGSTRRFDYTAIGDTVNLASRLEGANKPFGSRIMICQNIAQHVHSDVDTRYLGKVRVLGKADSVEVYELLARKDQTPPAERQYIEQFEQAVRLYQKSDFAAALELFEQYLKQYPDDKAAKLYYSLSQPLGETPLPENFDGSIELTQK